MQACHCATCECMREWERIIDYAVAQMAAPDALSKQDTTVLRGIADA